MRKHKESLERREFLKTSLKTAAGLGVLGISGVYLTQNRANAANPIQLKEQTMNLTPKAKQTFEKLFGNTDVPLAKSDPEFFTNYVNFAFDEVPTESKLELKELDDYSCLTCSHSCFE